MEKTRTPPLLVAIIVANVSLYIFSVLNNDIVFEFATTGTYLSPSLQIVGVSQGEWWRLLTGGFLHATPVHIFFNMLLLWILGKPIIFALGSKAFLTVYLISIAAGGLGAVLLTPNVLTIGASGGVFGLFGVAAVMKQYAGIDWENSGIKGLIILNLIITFIIPGVSIGGHLGGLAGGAAVGFIWKQFYEKKIDEGVVERPPLPLWLPVILLIVIVAVATLVPQTTPTL